VDSVFDPFLPTEHTGLLAAFAILAAIVSSVGLDGVVVHGVALGAAHFDPLPALRSE